MGNNLSQLPPEVQTHIKNITSSAGLPDSEESFEAIAAGWLEKLKIFEERTIAENMIESDMLDKASERGGVALTYSGSLVLIGPLIEGKRKTGYYSIGIRKNVPEMVSDSDSILLKDIVLNESIQFKTGPVMKTSPIFKIAICNDTVTMIEQDQKIKNVTVIMTKEFVDINKALVPR
ncbi:MAG: hypothetical protein OEY59_03465 [Deltaproteobacteria bacterium]|nr:hypothetical protein [Deltaproteobacteria bacterium]